MAQCEATVKTTGRENTGKQCRRMAVHGASTCERHGGVEASTTLAKVRKRIDRPGQRCTASKRDGSPCNAYALKGAKVCRKHGGTLPNVQKAARQRMLDLVDPALGQLQRIIAKADTSDADRLRAITLVLDRTGHGPKSDVQIEVKKYEALMSDIIRIAPAEGEVYSVTDVEPLALPAEATGDDSGPAEPEDGSINQPVFLGSYKRLRGTTGPPPHLR